MPGVAVAVGSFEPERFSAAMRKLAHIPAHTSRAIHVAPGLAIGWAGFEKRADIAAANSASGEVQVLRYGHSFKDDDTPRPVVADDILREYLAGGVAACVDYDGSFIIVIVDRRSQKLFVVPDRLSTQPLYYATRGNDIVIGPEVKALSTTLRVTPALSIEGVVGFLAAGYNVGTQTIFAGVQRLELGKMLEIDLASSKLTSRRFWKLDFATPDKFRKRADAEDALYEAIKHGHRLLMADNEPFQLLLSGGADSRGILGTCSALQVMPAKAMTWGFLKDVPRSDASISRRLAEQFGVPWHFIETRTDGFIENCEQWAYVSELANDNFGWYAEGFGTLNHMQQTGYSTSFIGDETWGWQGFAFDEAQSYAKVLAPSVPPSLLALMHESQREAAADRYVANIRDVMRDCQDTDWTDRKDFLYLHGRVARFIFSLGYNRGHATEQRRPFFTRAVLDVVRRLPTELRTHKNLYRTMLKRHMPQTTRVPYASVNSLPDWSYDLRTQKPLRECVLGLLNDPTKESSTLGALLDADRFGQFRDAYFAEIPSPISRQAPPASKVIKSQILEMLWTNSNHKYLDRWKNARDSSGAPRSIVQPVDVLRRVAILVLLERQLNRFQAV
jgi:hypothetical protein